MVQAKQPAREELLWLLRHARAPRLRSMRQFAEEEVVIPDGPFGGLKFRVDRQPFTRLWFDLVDIRFWNRKFAAGCTQSGKSLCCFVIPCLYHLFEMGETVICGLPDMDMAADKWREDLLPVIERTKYKELLPTSGGGSRGGQPDAIRFLNGATLKFMSGGGSDKSRAGFTSRVLVVTEVDGLDLAGESSREADKFTQLEARTLAFGENKCIYGECTVSIEQGRIWQELLGGTHTQPYPQCPHCQQHVRIERDNLVGWQNAVDEEEARAESLWSCPNCGECWSEADRLAANQAAVAVHRGQSVLEGEVQGAPPATRTMSFRWHAGHNFFYNAGYVGTEEWKASRSVDEENAEKKQRQFLFTLPHQPAAIETVILTAHGIQSRLARVPRGIIPADTLYLTTGCDIGKWLCHWILLAFRECGQIHAVDYGRLEVPSAQWGEEAAILAALRQFRDLLQVGWACEAGSPDPMRSPDEMWFDAGYQHQVIYDFCRESGDNFRPCVGYGADQRNGAYVRPKAKTKVIRYIGDEYHLAYNADQRMCVAEISSDHWKSFVHDRLGQELGPIDAPIPGGMTLFNALPREHLSLAKHLTAESKVQEFVAGKGMTTKWVKKHRNNHWFDASYYGCAAGHFCGFRLTDPTPIIHLPDDESPTPLLSPDGRPYLITER